MLSTGLSNESRCQTYENTRGQLNDFFRVEKFGNTFLVSLILIFSPNSKLILCNMVLDKNNVHYLMRLFIVNFCINHWVISFRCYFWTTFLKFFNIYLVLPSDQGAPSHREFVIISIGDSQWWSKAALIKIRTN